LTIKKPKLWQRLVAMGLVGVFVVIDQLVKLWAVSNLRGQGRMVVIPGFLGLRYAENTGISFGLLGDLPVVMNVVTAVTGLLMAAALVWLLLGRLPGMQMWAAALVLGGGLGNFIDRAVQGFVVDYLEFLFMRFAIFNLADVFITCGMVWLCVAIFMAESRKSKAMEP